MSFTFFFYCFFCNFSKSKKSWDIIINHLHLNWKIKNPTYIWKSSFPHFLLSLYMARERAWGWIRDALRDDSTRYTFLRVCVRFFRVRTEGCRLAPRLTDEAVQQVHKEVSNAHARAILSCASPREKWVHVRRNNEVFLTRLFSLASYPIALNASSLSFTIW